MSLYDTKSNQYLKLQEMYIDDRLFSENTEEVFYSVSMTEEEYELFSEFQETVFSKKNKKNSPKLANIDSHRGLGRAAVVGGMGGMVGGYVGKRKAEELDEAGASDSEIIRKSSEHAAKAGAAAGALQGMGFGAATRNPLAMIAGAGGGAVSGAAGAYLGARKNAQSKIAKRRLMRDDD
jgi:hypothetical protein